MAKVSRKPVKKAFAPKLPDSLLARRKGDIAILRLSRPQKRNALNDGMILGIEAFFQALPKDIKAVVIHGQGEHFSAGLDLSELTERNTTEAVMHSRMWHRVFDQIQFGRVPVVAVSVASPAPTMETVPSGSTTATFVLEDDQATLVPDASSPAPVAVAENRTASPTVVLTAFG